MEPIQIYDGFVELVNVSPPTNTEQAIVRAASVSYNKDQTIRSEESSRSLIDFLIENKHTSPLEMVTFTFHLKVPLSIATQILRHRTASVNCISHRYTKAEEGWYTPVKELADIRYQSELNKQVSVSEKHTNVEMEIFDIFSEMENLTESIYSLYERLLSLGVAREQARFYLPCGTYTRMYWSMDLHNLLHFLRLRMAPDAQYEVRLYAEAIYKLIQPFVPNVICSFERHIQKAITLNALEIQAILKAQGNLSECDISSVGSKRKQHEFAQKLEQLQHS